MNNDLNAILPLDQPYSAYPWEYFGTESVASIPPNVVDWVLVEVRDADTVFDATPATSLGGQAAFILQDGSIVDLDGSSTLSMNYSIEKHLYVVLWHRNHLPVLSENSVGNVGGTYTYDFTTDAYKAHGDNQSDLGGGKFGMIAGDLNADGTVDDADLTEQWRSNAGETGYYLGDGNMNTQVDNTDKNETWLINLGETEILPE